MNILLTNDDGMEGVGLLVLRSALKKAGHAVFVLCPRFNNSATSHGMTINLPFRIQKIEDDFYCIEGRPCDCVITAMKGNLLPFCPDIVLSGINRGGNIGTDIIYSGTVAAARQAAIYDTPGVAISVEGVFCKEKQDMTFEFLPLADFVAKNIDVLFSLCQKDVSFFLNINALSIPKEERYKGVVFTTLSKRVYNDKVIFEKQKDKEDETKMIDTARLQGQNLETFGTKQADFFAIQKKLVSITLINKDARTFLPKQPPNFLL